jgi:Plavaka transposase
MSSPPALVLSDKLPAFILFPFLSLFLFFFLCPFYPLLCMPLTLPSQPFTNDFPRADIHELLSPDILHQVIKGTFKDHLVTWVEEYLVITHGKSRANEILDDIDRR